MNIFEYELEYDDIDFDFYYNEDGEIEVLADMDMTQIRNILSDLERSLKMLPEHYNSEIWQEYQKRCKELLKRQD